MERTNKQKLQNHKNAKQPITEDENVAPSAVPSTNADYTLPQHQRQAAFSLLWLFVFSCCMFTLPFGTFFGVRHFVQTHYADATQFTVTAYSVLATVLTVNVIIAAYALVAYHETEYDNEGRVVDQSKTPDAPLGGGGGNKASTVSRQKARKEL